jgi:hypothetical protein
MTHVANPALEPYRLLHALAKSWWLLLLRGICAILFGVQATRIGRREFEAPLSGWAARRHGRRLQTLQNVASPVSL